MTNSKQATPWQQLAFDLTVAWVRRYDLPHFVDTEVTKVSMFMPGVPTGIITRLYISYGRGVTLNDVGLEQ